MCPALDGVGLPDLLARSGSSTGTNAPESLPAGERLFPSHDPLSLSKNGRGEDASSAPRSCAFSSAATAQTTGAPPWC